MATGSGMSSSAPGLLPPVKSVVVYKNGDPFYTGRRFVVNQRHIATMEAFLNEVTLSIGAPLAVRNLYTPRQGHKVQEFEDIESGGKYVAAGFERFKKLDYQKTGLKKQPVARKADEAKVVQRPTVSAKWRKFIPLPCIILVFRNGDLLCPPFRFIIPRSMQQDLEQILSMVTEKVSLRTGAVRRLCSPEGVTVTSAEELETGHCYVAVGAERFKKLHYLEMLVSKGYERLYKGNRRQSRRNESRKTASGPEDRYSDSALLDSPESDGRRVKSTGDETAEVVPPQAAHRRSRRGGREDSSVFYARPVRIRSRGLSSDGAASVFKRTPRKRREVQGAEVVQEDEDTATELPIDQRVADIVEEEELSEQNEFRLKTEQVQSPKQVGTPEESKSVTITTADNHNGTKQDFVPAADKMKEAEVKLDSSNSRAYSPMPDSSAYRGSTGFPSQYDGAVRQSLRDENRGFIKLKST